jgi:hypothetical protein
MGVVSNISFSGLGGLFLIWSSNYLGSSFLINFLRANLLLLLPALMAINVTTAGVVMAKLRELGDKYRAGFDETMKQMKLSFYEQVVLMFIAMVLLVLDGAEKVNINQHHMRAILESLISGCFIYSLIILFDTAKSIFIILRFEDDKGKKD